MSTLKEDTKEGEAQSTNIENIAAYQRVGVSEEDAVFFENFTPAQRKQLIWKVCIQRQTDAFKC